MCESASEGINHNSSTDQNNTVYMRLQTSNICSQTINSWKETAEKEGERSHLLSPFGARVLTYHIYWNFMQIQQEPVGITGHMAKLETTPKSGQSHDWANHMTEPITWHRQSHDVDNHMTWIITWSGQSHDMDNHMTQTITWCG